MMFDLATGADALERVTGEEIRELTRRATGATYVRPGLTEDENAFIERVVRISADCAAAAAAAANQHLLTATASGKLAGFVIATVHAQNDRELDWLMVDPQFHGTGVSSTLMRAGMDWLGTDRPMWLNVVGHNERAISFYRKHGFEIDPDTPCPKPMASWIMRRP